MNTTFLKQNVVCNECGFTTRDVALFNNHSCDVQSFGGRCEDYPCCGHEMGDCNGLLYGSDEAIKSDPHLLCDHNTGGCEVEDAEDEEEPEDLSDELEPHNIWNPVEQGMYDDDPSPYSGTT